MITKPVAITLLGAQLLLSGHLPGTAQADIAKDDSILGRPKLSRVRNGGKYFRSLEDSLAAHTSPTNSGSTSDNKSGKTTKPIAMNLGFEFCCMVCSQARPGMLQLQYRCR
jgi:hypothetical protein